MKEATIFWVFLRLGVVGFGTGPSMIPLMQEEAVERYHWMTSEAFTDAMGACNALPGPLATKMAFLIGQQHAGPLGGLAALCGVLLPSILAIGIAAGVLVQMQRSGPGSRFLEGIRPAVIALLLALVWDLAPASIRGVRTALLGVAVFAAVVLFKVHPAVALIASGVVGIFLLR